MYVLNIFNIACWRFFQQLKHPCIALHGLSPVVLKELFNDANISRNLYTLLLDETVTKQVTNQMDLLLYYLSTKNQAVIRYLNSRSLSHAKEDVLYKNEINELQKHD